MSDQQVTNVPNPCISSAPKSLGQEELDAVYKERNALVCALSKIFPSHLMDHPAEDKAWDAEWTLIVCVNGPTGQMTWHIRRDELAMFSHLSFRLNDWDGHTTEEKYRRLAAMPFFEIVPTTYREYIVNAERMGAKL